MNERSDKEEKRRKRRLSLNPTKRFPRFREKTTRKYREKKEE